MTASPTKSAVPMQKELALLEEIKQTRRFRSRTCKVVGCKIEAHYDHSIDSPTLDRIIAALESSTPLGPLGTESLRAKVEALPRYRALNGGIRSDFGAYLSRSQVLSLLKFEIAEATTKSRDNAEPVNRAGEELRTTTGREHGPNEHMGSGSKAEAGEGVE